MTNPEARPSDQLRRRLWRGGLGACVGALYGAVSLFVLGLLFGLDAIEAAARWWGG